MFKKKKIKSPKFKLDIPGHEGELLDKKSKVLNKTDLDLYYIKLADETSKLKAKNQILEWKIFGESYKGKYIFLELSENLYIFGTSKEDVKTIKAKNKKEAYLKFIENDSN